MTGREEVLNTNWRELFGIILFFQSAFALLLVAPANESTEFLLISAIKI